MPCLLERLASNIKHIFHNKYLIYLYIKCLYSFGKKMTFLLFMVLNYSILSILMLLELLRILKGIGFIITINMTCSIDQKLHLLFGDKLHEICIKL